MNRLERHTIALAVLAFLLLPSYIFAQANIRSEEINIVKEYKPKLANASKINFLPSLPPINQKPSNFEYNTPDRLLELKYPSKLIPAASIGKEKREELSKASVKAGVGNRSTTLLNANYYGSRENLHYNFYANHLAQNSLKLDHQAYSNNTIGAWGEQLFNKNTLKGDINYNRDIYHFYGYDHTTDTFSKEDVRQRYNKLNTTLTLKSHASNEIGLDHISTLSYYNLSNLNPLSENNISFTSTLSKNILERDTQLLHRANLGIGYNFINTTDSSVATQRQVINIAPQYHLSIKNLQFELGGDATWVNSIFYFLPYFNWTTNVIDNKLISFAGWDESLEIHTIDGFRSQNPFIGTNTPLRNSRVIDKYTGFRGYLGKKLNFEIRFAHKKITRLPLFINDTNDYKRFEVLYDRKATILNFSFGLSYQLTEKYQVTTTFEYNDYQLSVEAHPWHLPTFKFNLGGHYNLSDKIIISTAIFAQDPVKARDEAGSTITLKGIVDANLQATYVLNKNFSVFANFNNIASRQWQRFYHYPSYGFNGIIGLKYKMY